MSRRGIGISRLLIVLATIFCSHLARRRVVAVEVAQVLSRLHQQG